MDITVCIILYYAIEIGLQSCAYLVFALTFTYIILVSPLHLSHTLHTQGRRALINARAFILDPEVQF